MFRSRKKEEERRKKEEGRKKKEERRKKSLRCLSFKFLVCPNLCLDCYNCQFSYQLASSEGTLLTVLPAIGKREDADFFCQS
ncbi:MAG: hypothetical protein F6K48_06110 [Okeania sp. SIO3H1]|nr:hypothetical protein [Okeania sp. SIO3H1]